MTCVVGVVHERRVYLGADSAAVGVDALIQRRDTKVFRLGEAVVGVAGSFRVAQIVRYHAPPLVARRDMHRYLCVDWVGEFRRRVQAEVSTREGDEFAGGMLIGIAGQIWQVEGDYQVGRAVHAFDATGSGAQVALGSLWSTRGQPPPVRVRLALTAAETFSSTVRRPWRCIAT